MWNNSRVQWRSTTCTWLLFCLSTSILLLYLRTFSHNRTLRLTVYVILFFLVTTHAITFPLYFSSVTPLDCQWRQFETDEDYYAHCTDHFDQGAYIVFIAAFTILLDILIPSIPCPSILRLNMAKRQKIAILVILLAAVVYRLVLYGKSN